MDLNHTLASDVERTGHLMRRAGFGASLAEIQQRAQQGFDATIKDLLDGAMAPDDGQADWILDAMQRQDREGRLRPQMLKPWWIYRMVTTNRPLQEKMVLFWHGHFATSATKVPQAELMLQQNRFFRENALANWRDILKGVSRDAAMILWLDNNTNYKSQPNENYGRELMELFSLGIGNYSETDVKEGARCFTGWGLRGGDFYFNPGQHDTGIKTYLGRVGNMDGDDLIDAILDQPAAAEFLTRKLFAFFAYENAGPEVIGPLAEGFRRSNYDTRALVEAIFRSDAFWSGKALNTQIKSPAQLVIGGLRALNIGAALAPGETVTADANDRNRLRRVYGGASNSLKQMGQDLFYPPNVKGWDGGAAWINSATMLARLSFAEELTSIAGPLNAAGGIEQIAGSLAGRDSEEIVNTILSNLGPITLPQRARDTLARTVEPAGPTAMADVRGYQRVALVKQAVALAMQSPQFQVC